jgi:hypothetical protein
VPLEPRRHTRRSTRTSAITERSTGSKFTPSRYLALSTTRSSPPISRTAGRLRSSCESSDEKEEREILAGYQILDVESYERALEIAARA